MLITGASDGIGRATAELLGREGAKVALAARSVNKLEEVAATLDEAFVVPVDMTDPESISDMVEQTVAHFGRLDILINNAGRGLLAPVTKVALDDLKDLMALNLYGPLLALQAVVPVMREQGGGTVLTVGSAVSKMAIPGIGAYAATKYATNALMLTARNELEADNIRVSIVHPGSTATSFGNNAIRDPGMTLGGPSGLADPPEAVARKILEALDNDAAEYFMTKQPQPQPKRG